MSVTSAPPTVMVSIGRRKGEQKDTGRNLEATGEGVIHIPHRALAEKMVATSAEVGPEVSEVELAGLATVASSVVKPPRLRDAAVALEARVSQHLHVGTAPMDVFFLEILRYHLDDAVLVNGVPDPAKLAAVGRLGGAGYCDTSAPFDIPRPT